MKTKDIDKPRCCHKVHLNFYFVLKCHVTASKFALLSADNIIDSHKDLNRLLFHGLAYNQNNTEIL